MKAYMGHSITAGAEEGAILIFAHNCKEARKIGFPDATYLFGSDWIDFRVKWLKQEAKWLLTQADQEKLKNDIPHVIDNPNICTICELWGSPMVDGICADCRNGMEK